jgi:hypothetical protein
MRFRALVERAGTHWNAMWNAANKHFEQCLQGWYAVERSNFYLLHKKIEE